MVQRIERRRRAATVARVTSVAACLLAAVAILQFQPFGAAGGPPGGITCGECLEHQGEYQAGELKGQKIAEQIREHIAGCPHCAEKFKSESPQASQKQPSEHMVTGFAAPSRGLIAAEF